MSMYIKTVPSVDEGFSFDYFMYGELTPQQKAVVDSHFCSQQDTLIGFFQDGQLKSFLGSSPISSEDIPEPVIFSTKELAQDFMWQKVPNRDALKHFIMQAAIVPAFAA